MNTHPVCTNRHEVEPETELTQSVLVHHRAMLCCRMASLLHHALTGITWPDVRFADRSRLDRALARLESDIGLARMVIAASRDKAGAPTGGSTTKAASSGDA